MYTDGSTAFWDLTGNNLITSNLLPPAAAARQSRVMLRTPAGDYTSTTAPPVITPFPDVSVTQMQIYLKTPSIHHDVGCRVEIAFVLRPAISITTAILDDVRLHKGGNFVYCLTGSLDRATGFGTCIVSEYDCTALFPAGAVDQTLAITLSFKQNVVSQSMDIMVAALLAPNATSASHTSRGTAYVTRAPVVAGASFPMRVTANTATSVQNFASLYSWELKVTYDPNVLNPSINRVSLSSVYDSLSTSVQVNSATEHVLTALAFVKTGFEANTAGAQVDVCTVDFIVSPTVVLNTVVRGVKSAVFTSMINEGNNVFTGTSPAIMINDLTPASLTNTADLLVIPVVGLIGIRAYTTTAHLVMKPAGIARETASITVVGVWSGYGRADTAVVSVSCLEQHIASSSRLNVATCLQILPLATPTPLAPVAVTSGVFNTFVDFRVHVASTVRLVAVRGTLAKLNSARAPACDGAASLYQSTRIRKMVQFNDGSGVMPTEVDVTKTDYDFNVVVSGDTASVDWDGVYGIATGLGIGIVTFTPQVTALTRTITPVSITIVNSAVTFGGISLFSFNAVSWLKSGLTPVFQDVNSFTKEGQGHTIVAVTIPDGDFTSVPLLLSSVPAVYGLTLMGVQSSRYYQVSNLALINYIF